MSDAGAVNASGFPVFSTNDQYNREGVAAMSPEERRAMIQKFELSYAAGIQYNERILTSSLPGVSHRGRQSRWQ